MDHSAALKRKRPSDLQSGNGECGPSRQKQCPNDPTKEEESTSLSHGRLPTQTQNDAPAPVSESAESVQSPAAAPEMPEFFRPINYWRRHHRWPSYRCTGDWWSLNHLQDLKVPETQDDEDETDPEESCFSILPGYRIRKSEARFKTVDDIPTEVLYENQMLNAGNVAHSTTRDVWLQDQEHDSRDELSDASAALCRSLLQSKEPTPTGTLFDDEFFKKICKELKYESKTKLVSYVGSLLVPSVAELRARGEPGLDILTETVRQTWRRCIPVFPPSPVPDFSVGFYRRALGAEREAKLWPYLGEAPETSPFAATTNMLFPFLNVAAIGTRSSERMNATEAGLQSTHCAIIAMRSVIELFRCVSRAHEINGEILAFSVTYDTRWIQIYGHYADVSERNVHFYRHDILSNPWVYRESSADTDRWLSYQFIKSLYKDWAPRQLQRICSAIDDLPSWDVFRVSKSLPGSQSPPPVDEEKEKFANIWPSFLKGGEHD
ncbi:hypothetical protein BC567DRAFT_267899 [Phyllosticta citribraziliensis]